MPVQPMKSIAAVALAQNLSREEVSASGVLVGGMMIFLAVTNAIEVVNAVVPKEVVSGLQLGLGVKVRLGRFHGLWKQKVRASD